MQQVAENDYTLVGNMITLKEFGDTVRLRAAELIAESKPFNELFMSLSCYIVLEPIARQYPPYSNWDEEKFRGTVRKVFLDLAKKTEEQDPYYFEDHSWTIVWDPERDNCEDEILIKKY